MEHINVYSRSESELGRLLSNFAHTPFVHEGVRFASVEAWWYYRQHGDPRLPSLHGYAAKQMGQALGRGTKPDPTPGELFEVYLAKVEQNPRLKRMLVESSLPFDHYYVYDGRRVYSRHRWTGELWASVREAVK